MKGPLSFLFFVLNCNFVICVTLKCMAAVIIRKGSPGHYEKKKRERKEGVTKGICDYLNDHAAEGGSFLSSASSSPALPRRWFCCDAFEALYAELRSRRAEASAARRLLIRVRRCSSAVPLLSLKRVSSWRKEGALVSGLKGKKYTPRGKRNSPVRASFLWSRERQRWQRGPKQRPSRQRR